MLTTRGMKLISRRGFTAAGNVTWPPRGRISRESFARDAALRLESRLSRRVAPERLLYCYESLCFNAQLRILDFYQLGSSRFNRALAALSIWKNVNTFYGRIFREEFLFLRFQLKTAYQFHTPKLFTWFWHNR